MNNVQLENGYTKIANELFEALMSTPFSGYEFRVVQAIIRKTYGYGKTKDRIALSQIKEITKIGNKSHVSRTLTSLISYGVITKIGNDLKLNKNYLAWKVTKLGNRKKALNLKASVTKLGNDKKLPKSVKGVTKIGNKSLPKSAPQKKKETITKESIYIQQFLKDLLTSWNDMLGTNYRTIDSFEDNAGYWLQHYTAEEISEAITKLPLHKFWKDKMTPTMLFRKKNPRGERVDYIGELLNTKQQANEEVLGVIKL